MGLREFLRGGYHHIKSMTMITDRHRPVAMYVPFNDPHYRLLVSDGTELPVSDDGSGVVSSEEPVEPAPDRRGRA